MPIGAMAASPGAQAVAGAPSFRRSTRPPPARPALVRCQQQQQQQQQQREAAPQQWSEGAPSSSGSSRRALLLAAGGLALAAAAPSTAWAGEGEGDAGTGGEEELVSFSNPSQGYTVLRPASWVQVGKAGADALFKNPARQGDRKYDSLGITVYPVAISSLEEFGDLAAVGERLLKAERDKESTLGVTMVAAAARPAAAAAAGSAAAAASTLYDFEYELDSTRGRKRVFSTVTVVGRKLFISNGQVWCGKGDACDGGAAAALPLVRAASQSLAVPAAAAP